MGIKSGRRCAGLHGCEEAPCLGDVIQHYMEGEHNLGMSQGQESGRGYLSDTNQGKCKMRYRIAVRIFVARAGDHFRQSGSWQLMVGNQERTIKFHSIVAIFIQTLYTSDSKEIVMMRLLKPLLGLRFMHLPRMPFACITVPAIVSCFSWCEKGVQRARTPFASFCSRNWEQKQKKEKTSKLPECKEKSKE